MTVPVPKLQIEVLLDSPVFFRCGMLSNVVACAWRGPLNDVSFARLAKMALDLKERVGPLRHSYVHLMTERVQIPDAATRSEIAKLMSELTEHVGCAAVVLDSSGFWSSALRGFLTGLRVLAPRTFDIRAETSIESLLQWFPAEHLKRSGVAVTREQVEYLLNEARSWQNP